MHEGRRMRTFYKANELTRFVCFCAYLTLTASSEHSVPIEIKLWDTGRTPLAHMVDVTNEFGLKVLAEHNFLNDNNIAFSPYGLMGIMVALFEGVDGESSYQIQRGMQLPWNRNVMRIGFRDIHRTLKTYFIPEEGFLAGLALNNENVTFNEQYKKILRFYGFDLENDQLPTLSPETNNTSNITSTVTSTMSTVSSGDSTTTAMTAENTPSSTVSNREETSMTINPNAETLDPIDIRGPTTATSQSSAPNAISTTMSTVITETTTNESVTETVALTTVTTTQTTTSQTETTTDAQTATSTAQTAVTSQTEQVTATGPPTALTETIQTMNDDADQSTTSISTMTTETAALISRDLTNEPTINIEMTTPLDGSPSASTLDISDITSQTLADAMSSTIQLTTDSSTPFSTPVTENTSTVGLTTSISMQETDQTSTTVSDMSITTNSMTTIVNESTLENLERRKRSIVDFIFANPPYLDDYLYYRSYDIGSEVNKPIFDDEMFLANGLKSVQVTYMHYDTILEYVYLPHLEASALRLPLDSDRYYLLVVLPKREGPAELGRLISRMARESDLSDIYSVLRPRRVKGIVPSFTVKGHVTLTTDLQKLGIRDVFEPRQRDFTPMTKQVGVYVRSIEQAVSVAIRKYRPDDQKKHRYVTNRDPVVFSATYPFLYFVMDANIHVALMAGKMADPLNSRIL